MGKTWKFSAFSKNSHKVPKIKSVNFRDNPLGKLNEYCFYLTIFGTVVKLYARFLH